MKTLPTLKKPPLPVEEIRNHVCCYLNHFLPLASSKNYVRECYREIFENDALWISEMFCLMFIASAKKNRTIWNCVGDFVTIRAEKRLPLPKNIAEFVNYQIKREDKKPSHRGTDPRKNDAYKYTILEALCYAEKLGLKPTRNESSDPISGCDIVAEELSKITERTEYETIRKLRERNFEYYKTIFQTLKLQVTPINKKNT